MNAGETTHYYQIYFRTPLEKGYTYSSSSSDLLDKRVRVTLKNKSTIGFVDSRCSPPSGVKIKEILEVLDEEPVITEEQKELARWISEQYLSSYGESLSLFFSFKKEGNPAKGKHKDKPEPPPQGSGE